MFWIAKSLASCVKKIEIMPNNFSEQNPIILIYKKPRTYRKRLSETLLQCDLIRKSVKIY